MKQSTFYIPTLRETPSDAEAISHKLLLKGGYIRQHAAGVYSFLPLGYKVIKKIEDIVREEMNNIGGQELLMPVLHPSELWKESGRWFSYGSELMRMTDKNKREFALGATHEEIITSLIRNDINSYKHIPSIMYQIQTKFRDEKRTRYGLLRGREFIMKDGYSFHHDDESLNNTYEKVNIAYKNVLNRLNIKFRTVIADSGAMGGKDTQEFMALADIGEDTIAYSDSSDYAANIEMTPVNVKYTKEIGEELPFEYKDASYASSFEGSKVITKFFKVDKKVVILLHKKEHTFNDVKLKNLYQSTSIEELNYNEIKNLKIDNFEFLDANFLIENGIDIVADNSVKYTTNAMLEIEYMDSVISNFNIVRDIRDIRFADLRMIEEGEESPDSKGNIKFAKGIEIGHIFKLGTRYSKSMNATIINENGERIPLIMGCYGLGISRILGAIVEQNNDTHGIIWPKSIAPFDIHIIPAKQGDIFQRDLSNNLYGKLKNTYEVLLDDRNERAGVKFKDSDLYGIPVRIIVGKQAVEGFVEVKYRDSEDIQMVDIEELNDLLMEYFK